MRCNICRLNSRESEACSTSIENDNKFNKHLKDKRLAHRKVDLDLSEFYKCVIIYRMRLQ